MATVDEDYPHVRNWLNALGWCDECVYEIERMRDELAGWRKLTEEKRHKIKVKFGDWTIEHPLMERIDGSLFDCQIASKLRNELYLRFGEYWLNDDGSLGEHV